VRAVSRVGAETALADVLLRDYPGDASALLETARDEDSAALLAELSTDAAVAVISRLTPDRAARLIAALPASEASAVLLALAPQRAAALLARLDPDERERRLAPLDRSVSDELRALATWPSDSAGGLMDPRVTSFRPDTRVRDVLERLRRFRDRRISDVFLVDEQGRLTGSVSLQDIALEDPDAALGGLARPGPVAVAAIAPRDEVIETFERQRVESLPVVDIDRHLLGVLRQRELVQAAQQQATADAVTMVGASEEERALSSPLFAVRKRLPWLQINLLTAFLAATVVGLFENTIAKVTALAVLLPVVAGQSGNTGAQALAVTMRGLALREVRTSHWVRVATKEGLAGAMNGVAVALTTAGAVWLWSRSWGLAAVIGVSMVISMTLAGLAGAAIPMALTALRQDPAQSSSIFLTTVTDVVGFFSFLGIATLLMAVL
jgi:magnesium transporter